MSSEIERKEEKPAASWIWLKDSSGHPSVTVTMLTVSFWITTFTYVASTFVKIGPLEIRQFDAGASAAYFGAILTLYFGRRYTEARYGNPNAPKSDAPPTSGEISLNE